MDPRFSTQWEQEALTALDCSDKAANPHSRGFKAGRLLCSCRLRNLPGGDDARFGLLMGSLGMKLVGRARPLEYLALIKAILHARGIKLPQDADTQVCQLHALSKRRTPLLRSEPQWILSL